MANRRQTLPNPATLLGSLARDCSPSALRTTGSVPVRLLLVNVFLTHALDLGKQKRGTLGLEPLPEDTFVVFVLGGPGAGKGTQCANLVRDYGFVHLSAGDLLREERQRPGSPYGELINNIIKEGQIVPMEITISLLHQAMKKSGAKRFLIDGFPRAVDQSDKFEEEVCQGKLVLYFECPEEELLKRLLKRGETSGRVDDNIESIKKRFQVFKSTSYPVIESFARRGKVASISCLNTVDGVYQDTRKVIDQHFPPQK
ncbi:adenylate kinase-domain-containing protein [Zopfochytrium polystomum]|nr:adenylate kinase-domain-containing protein [Zopfochytrium polystomum]